MASEMPRSNRPKNDESPACAVALGVVGLALDGIAPVVRHFQEASLQCSVSSLHLRHPVLRLQTGVQRVRLVEMRQHLAVPLLGPIQLGQLLGDVGLE